MLFRPCTPVAGLSYALALSVEAVDSSRRQLQASTFCRGLAPCVPGPPDLAPLAVEPCPEAGAWERNTRRFLALVHSATRNPNPYNDHGHLAHAAVVCAGWGHVPPGFAYPLAPGRAAVRAGLDGPENTALVRRFALLLAVAGFDKRYPVLFDGGGNILDGLHRLRACAKTNERFYFLQLDF